MAINFLETVQQNGIDFVANKKKTVAINRDNLIRRLRLKIFVNVTSGMAMAPVADKVTSNILPLLALAMPKNNFKFEIDLTKYIFKEEIQKGKPIVSDASLPTMAMTTKELFWYVDIDFAQDVKNKTDITALLNAPALESLELQATWADENALSGTLNGLTIDATKSGISIEQLVVYDDDPKQEQALLNQKYIDIREGISVFQIDRAYGSFTGDSLDFDLLPVPAQILQQVMLTKLNTDAPSDAVVTQIKIEDTRGSGKTILNRDYESLNAETQSLFGDFVQRAGYVGVLNLDYLDMFHVGILNVNAEAIKLKFLTKAPMMATQNKIEVYTKYIAGR